MTISAGEGSSDQLIDGGDGKTRCVHLSFLQVCHISTHLLPYLTGGDIILTAGEAKGSDSIDNGGLVSILGGAANKGPLATLECTQLT